MIFLFKGIGASEGIAIGKAFLYKNPEIIIEKNEIEDIDLELSFFKKSIEESKEDLNILIDKCKNDEQKEILNAHLLLTEDYEIINQTENRIKNGENLEYAFTETVNGFINMFAKIEDEYLRARGADLKDVYNRIICKIKNIELNPFENLEKGSVIIADDLLASDTMHINWDYVEGFATNLGSKTSHTAIIAKNFGIPCVVGMVSNTIKSGDNVIIDGFKGEVYSNVSNDIVLKYKEKLNSYLLEKKQLEEIINLPTITKSGKKIDLCVNAGSVEEVENAFKKNIDGIGLFRTEFLYMNNKKFPTEEEQFEVYKKILELAEDKYVVIRTLDIGGDKSLPYYKFEEEENPFLGVRGIRLCFKLLDIFKVQLKALLRASVYGNLHIMLPMVINKEEVVKTKEIIFEIKEELNKEGIKFSNNIKLGIMIETPASVILSDILAKEVDFFSIGTNDLTQYILAVDRGNEKISDLYDSGSLSVLRAIKTVIETGKEYGISVGMCGELAGDSNYTKYLLDIGLDKFSVSGSLVGKVKNVIINYE